ncbi:MAG TPA: hypothetical protein GYA10_11675 [Alphaproteobacteria bacterium]|nr:hypothetical protein [Alphaproteobacteria bacterium]
MLPIHRIGLALLAIVAFALPAAAAETGTRAWLIHGQALYAGPGAAYDVVGELGEAARIRVDRCTDRWCRIHAGSQRGWVSRDNVSFGQHPRGPLTGPRLDYPSGAMICLYEGPGYSGESLCMKPGTVVHDLLLFRQDNRYSSVQVNGGSVTLCRDRDFASYCMRVIEDQPRLHGFLDDNVSSVRVW